MNHTRDWLDIAAKNQLGGPELLRIGIGGVVPVQWEVEKSGDPGTLTGWSSVYGVVDQQDDIVLPGAFKRTMDQWRASKGQRPIPLTLDHQNTAEGVIGSLSDFQDTSYGLKTTFRFSSTQKAQDARANAREGHLNGLSIFGPIFQKAFNTVGGKSVRLLKEVGLAFVGLTPMPANTDSLVLTAKSVSDKPWEQFTEADYTPEQWAAACLIDTGEGLVTAKSRYKLPVREPEGSVNRAGAHAAAGALAGARGGVDASDEQKTAAAKKLVGIYKSDLDEDPPAGLLKAAGMASAAVLTLPDSWVNDMRSALGITVQSARDAAVDLLVKAQYSDVLTPPAATESAVEDEPTRQAKGDGDAAASYALAVIGESGPGESPPGGDPSASSLDGLLASAALVDATSITSDLNALEAELRSVSSDHAVASEGTR